MAVTRNDVARRARVSPGVVSYVLNDGPRPVAKETRKRVLDAVKELGYRPDGLARSLRIGRTRTLGLVLPDASNPFFAELARAIENAAYARGHAVMVCNSADDSTREHTYIQSLADRRIDGLILISATSSQDLSDVTGISIPVVALDRSPDESPISTIRSDNEHGAYLGATHLHLGVDEHRYRSNYTSYEFGKVLAGLDLRRSMGRTGICYDNAMAESFFAALKNELCNRTVYPTRAAAMTDIARYIETRYNPRRLHSAIGYRPPNEVHNAYRTQQMAA